MSVRQKSCTAGRARFFSHATHFGNLGHTFPATPNNLLRGRGCPICKMSMGEKRTARWLEQNNLIYKREWTGHGLRAKKK